MKHYGRKEQVGPKAINHLTKCFTYAVKGNSDRESLENNHRAELFHSMSQGTIQICGDWCG